jgi:threonine/homoserine/homoserine lactone efflux protein
VRDWRYRIFTTHFILTSLVVVLMPGTGAIYTVSTGVTQSWRAGIVAAIGCTLGIIPHLLASILGLSAVMHMSAVTFSVAKYVGSAYLLYLAWQMWRDAGTVAIGSNKSAEPSYMKVAWKGIVLNLLNPKLTIFFLAFMPQFIAPGEMSATQQLVWLSAAFMLMTLVVFCLYGLIASGLRTVLGAMPRAVRWIQRSFAMIFAAMAVKLAFTEQ